jgi:hypothetical protein
VVGSGLDVWELCLLVDEYPSVAKLVAEMQLAERQVRLALAYRERYPEEVAETIAENQRPVDEWHELYPFVRTV